MTDIIHTDLPADERPMRTRTIEQKIPRTLTGLNGSIFLHLDYIGERGAAIITGIRCSEKGKDGSSLDKVLTAIGDGLTSIIREEINAPDPAKPDGLHIVKGE